MALNRLKQHYLSDTLNGTSLDSLILLLENENDLQEKYELVFAYLQKGDWENALDLTNGIPAQFNLNCQQQASKHNELTEANQTITAHIHNQQ